MNSNLTAYCSLQNGYLACVSKFVQLKVFMHAINGLSKQDWVPCL